jgi:small-conductance mechanosensitive channel
MRNVQSESVQLIVALFLVTGLVGWLVRRVLHRLAHSHKPAQDQADVALRRQLIRGAIGPVSLLVWYYGLWAIAHTAIQSEWVPEEWRWLDQVLWKVALVGLFISGFWLLFRATEAIDGRLKRFAAATKGRVDDVLLPLIGTALRVTVPILGLILATRLSPLSAEVIVVANKVLSIALVVAMAWLVRRAILLTETALVRPAAANTPDQRALLTRVRVLRRIAMALVVVFTISAVLMTFEEVRDVGRSLLASAGVAGIVIGLAAQRSLGNLFAGLQIALTQPVRIGDLVLVEGEVGNIEEITLTYVVVRIWDLRRIVLPISYFIEKPFQNWTRVPTNILSPLTLRVDFSLPVGELREFLKEEIAKSPNWDKQVFGVQVTNTDSSSMEVRVLGSAADPGASFNLQCELREKAIEWIRANYPECLPKQRREQRQLQSWETGATPGRSAASAAEHMDAAPPTPHVSSR